MFKLASFLITFLLLTATSIMADIRGTDASGRPVILRSDGTWVYVTGGSGGGGKLTTAPGKPCAANRAFVKSLYHSILDRQPDPSGLNYWTGRLKAGRTKKWLVAQIFKSVEYRGFNKSNRQFVRDAYQAVLGREPEPAGRANWIRQLTNGMPRDTLIQNFLRSAEYTLIMVRCGNTIGGGGGTIIGGGGSVIGGGGSIIGGGGGAIIGGGGTGSSTGNITWNFETGNTRGWTKTGTAFDHQPTFGDNPTARRRGQPSRHVGNFWIGTYEKYQRRASQRPGDVQGDSPKGTMATKAFRIPSGNLSFLVGGGSGADTSVDLIVSGRVVLSVSGRNTETMHRVTWNLNRWSGKYGRIRIVDNSSAGWGHINVDDFRFGTSPAGSGSIGTGGRTAFLGCFIDKPDRDVKGHFFSHVEMTSQLCINTCKNKGYRIASTQYANQCFCGNSYGRYGRAPASECNYTCSGDKQEKCGGNWRNSVYKIGAGNISPPPPTQLQRTFVNPKWKGHVVDNCVTWATTCGGGGADNFCRKKGYAKASKWTHNRPGTTWVIGSNKVCRGSFCVGYSSITCTR